MFAKYLGRNIHFIIAITKRYIIFYESLTSLVLYNLSVYAKANKVLHVLIKNVVSCVQVKIENYTLGAILCSLIYEVVVVVDVVVVVVFVVVQELL